MMIQHRWALGFCWVSGQHGFHPKVRKPSGNLLPSQSCFFQRYQNASPQTGFLLVFWMSFCDSAVLGLGIFLNHAQQLKGDRVGLCGPIQVEVSLWI